VAKNGSQKFTHIYHYWGEYTVSLEYYTNDYVELPDAADKIFIKVVPAEILISAVGNEKDFFVELSNNSPYESDISNWVLSGSGKSFTIPRNTIIGSKKKIMISSFLTSFTILDKNTLTLKTPEGNIAFDYPSSVASVAKLAPTKAKVETKVSVSQNSPAVQILAKVASTPKEQISVNNLPISLPLVGQASVIESDAIENSNSYLPMLLSLIFIGGSAGAVYYIRQKKNVVNAGDDFNILDE
jgi:hypothetical protein